MASGLVPDFPALTDALEHLRELEKELREDGVAFSAEASFHLSNITAAVTELEGHQRAAQEAFEAESRENGRLVHRIDITKETMRQEITAEVAAARTGGAAERDRLQKELLEVSQLHDATVEKQEDLARQDEMLHAEKQQAQSQQDALVAALHHQVKVRNGLQMQLDRSREQLEELKSCSATAEQDKIGLQTRMELEREAFRVKGEDARREVEQVEEELEQQKQAVRRARKALARGNGRKQEAQERLNGLTSQRETLESSLLRETASRSQREEELEAQTQTHHQLREKEEVLKKDLQESKVSASTSIQRLKEEIRTLEGETQDGRASRELHRDSLAHVAQALKQQQAEESKARAEHLRVERQLQTSKLLLEERVASISRHKKEIRETDEQIRELLQAGRVRQRLFERDLQEMSSTLEAQRSTVARWEEEKKQLAELLEAARSQQEEHVAKLTSDIRSTGRRYQELLQEEAELQEQGPLSLDAELLRRHLKQREAKFREEEARQRQEVERYATDADLMGQSNTERQRQVEEEEERLKEAEAAWRAEELRNMGMKSLVAELKRRETDVELMLLELTEKTRFLLQPRQEAKAQLEEARKRSTETLETQTSELRDAEMSMYECVVKVEQVRMENSRFQLCIRQMLEEVSRAEEDRDRYLKETRLLGREVQEARDSLQQRWKEDACVRRDRRSRDGGLLAAMNMTRSRLKSRREEVEEVSRLFQQQALAFPVHQSLSAALPLERTAAQGPADPSVDRVGPDWGFQI